MEQFLFYGILLNMIILSSYIMTMHYYNKKISTLREQVNESFEVSLRAHNEAIKELIDCQEELHERIKYIGYNDGRK